MKNSQPVKRIYLGKIIFAVIILLAVTAITVYCCITLSRRDEVIIKERLHTLADDLSKSAKESTATALLKVKGISGAFAYPMTLAMDNYAQGSYDHERLLSSAGRYRTMISTVQVTASDIIVEIAGKDRAKVYFSGRFAGTLKNGINDTIIKDIEADLIKLDGKWLIKSIKFRNVLH